MKNKKIKVVFLLFCFCLIIFALVSVIFDNKAVDYLYADIDIEPGINNEAYYEHIINTAREKYNNNDVVGILQIDNTDYSVPIMQGDDNDYYLKHTPYGEYSSSGSVYLDYRTDINNSKKLLIYGHNSSNIDMPFKILEEYYDRDYYDNHKYVSVTTNKTKKKYEIFSVYVETSDFSYMDVTFADSDEYLRHLENLKSKSMYDTGVTVSKDDEVLILQTCSEHPDYRNYQKKYLLIILRRVWENEKI